MTTESAEFYEPDESEALAALMTCYNPAPLWEMPVISGWPGNGSEDETLAVRLPVTCYDD